MKTSSVEKALLAITVCKDWMATSNLPSVWNSPKLIHLLFGNRIKVLAEGVRFAPHQSGGSRIRTCDHFAAIPVFKTGAIVHSAIPPPRCGVQDRCTKPLCDPSILPYLNIILPNFLLKRKYGGLHN